jgi:chromosome partitioning protein
MAPTLACVNLKGGVGKTAIAVNFAAYCGMKKLKTLLIDLDPQTNATFSCISVQDWQTHASKKGTVADLLGARSHANAQGSRKEIQSVIRKGVFKNVDLIPSHLDLFTVDLDMASATGRENRLRRALQPVQDKYDIIVCDCPPNLTIPTQNALAASSHYIVPVSPDFLSALGVGLLLSRIVELSDELERDLTRAGIIISRIGRPAQHRAETVAALRKTFGKDVLNAEIRERASVAKSAEKNLPVYQMGDTDADSEFRQMSIEVLQRMGVET